VDDEPLARRGVAARLRKLSGVEVVGECANGPSAVESIVALAPDLVFLDVQMPGMDGFEVLRVLPADRRPHVIFLTAYEQYAVRAFEIHALDYLLKPIDDLRFQEAVARARTHAGAKCGVAHFAVRSGTRIRVVPAHEVEWVGAAGDYAELHTRSGCYLLRETMNSLERKLEPSGFIRIHRSRLVRRDSIRELRSIENGELIVKLADNSEHRSSRTYAARLDDWLATA
jgi:two-component system LytT family response regulator